MTTRGQQFARFFPGIRDIVCKYDPHGVVKQVSSEQAFVVFERIFREMDPHNQLMEPEAIRMQHVYDTATRLGVSAFMPDPAEIEPDEAKQLLALIQIARVIIGEF